MGQTVEDFPEDRSGCGLERVAELTGRSYGEVRALWVLHGGDPWMLKAAGHAGLYDDEVMRLYRELTGCALRVVVAQGPCIIAVRDKFGFGHYVGGDGRRAVARCRGVDAGGHL
jgi:hypothetical protein